MAVVVNEFEVVPEAAKPREPAAPAPAAEAPHTSVAAEVERTLRTLQERALRLRAD
jgi:hypothetical protein